MPSWKKVILSGSNASLNQLTVSTWITGSVSGSFTGSLMGTASFASNGVTGGTSNYISKYGSATTLATSSIYDNGTRIGIGMNTPSKRVTISTPDSQTTSIFFSEADLAGYGGLVQYDATTDTLQLNTLNNSTEYNGVAVTRTDANVGIGTTSPLAKLHVRGLGSTSATTAFYVENASSTNLVTVLDNGNVGIGASSPSQKLQVAGNVLITGSLTVGSSSLGSNENTLVVGLPPAGGTGEGGQILLQASGGLYTSASMIDTYQNQFRILRGTNAGSDAAYYNLDLNDGTSTFSGYVKISGAPNPYSQFNIKDSYTPSGNGDPNGNNGDICWDDNYIYVKTGAGWKRAALDGGF